MEQVRSFAMDLMHKRKRIGNRALHRDESFNTQMGMAYSLKPETQKEGDTAEESSDYE